MALYILAFNDDFASREKITGYLDTRPDIIKDWYYCLTNAIFVETSLSAKEFRDFLHSLSKEGRFFISEIKRVPLNDGWLPKNAWEFINKYS